MKLKKTKESVLWEHLADCPLLVVRLRPCMSKYEDTDTYINMSVKNVVSLVF